MNDRPARPFSSSPLRVDLHVHSTASDGRWPPARVVSEVARAGIGLFAVADHDTVANVLAVEQLAREKKLVFIRAVEVSATLDGHLVHILGYGIDPHDTALNALLWENWDKLAAVDDQSITILLEAGYPVSWSEFQAYEHDPTRGGWKALNYLIDKGICRGVRDYFERLFVGDMAITYPEFALPDRVVEVIHECGGTAVLAHPGHSLREDRLALLDQLLQAGVQGLECYSPYHNPQTTAQLVSLCHTRGLLITAGSDCHGGFVGRELGQPKAYLADLSLGPLLDYALR